MSDDLRFPAMNEIVLRFPWVYEHCSCNVWPMLAFWPGRCRRCGEPVEPFAAGDVRRRSEAVGLFIDIYHRLPWTRELELSGG